MRPLRYTLTLAALLAPLALARDASAVWPPPANATREELSNPANWPNDPDYGNLMGARGQWEHYSWIPLEARTNRGFRTEELAIGSGNNTDAAWGLTIGDPRVLIAVLDSGINWDNEDLQLAAALNINELPLPQTAAGMPAASYDADGDGVINVADYINDARVPCGPAALPHPLRMCRGADGMPNDPNRNGIMDAGDLIRVFSDGTDADANGYVDDISGWDFFHDDNDPADNTRYGHGTGEARDSTARANNGIGGAGGCPRCQFVPTRVGDSFITDVNDFAQGVIYGADADYGQGRRVRVIQEALGTINNTAYGMQAIDYAYARGLAVIASAADENSRHHNMPGTNNHTVYVHAVTHNGNTPQSSTSFLNFNNCTNYGGQLQLSVAGASCSSEAVGQLSGISGLVYSMALERNLDPALSSEEVRQLFLQTTDDINIPESIPGAANYNPTIYPSLPGWDQRFGYGRTNARRAVEWVRDGRIPPEVDITSPRWFTTLFTDREQGRRLRIEGRIAARRAPSFDYVIEWARGIEPADGDWRQLRMERNVTAPVTNMLADLDLTTLNIDNPGEIENRFTITVRIRATAHYNAPVGDVPGEVRRVFAVHSDPDLLPGYPIDVVSSGESSAHMVDLNGDGRREIVMPTADGLIHAFRADATELPGFPVHTDIELGFDPAPARAMEANYLAGAAYRGATPAIDPRTVYESVLATPGIADIDGDGDQEIVVASYHGAVYVWNHDGTPYGHGFPYRLPRVRSEDTAPDRIIDRGIFGSPVLFDLDRDGRREIIFGAFDGRVYALRSQDAAIQPGYPVLIHNEQSAEFNRVFGSVGVGNFDGDMIPDLVVVSNERQTGDRHTGAMYLVHGDGMLHAGGPFHPNWPIVFPAFESLPLIGQGISTAPPIADLDGDGLDDLTLTGGVLSPTAIGPGRQGPHPRRPDFNQIQTLSLLRTEMRGLNSSSRSNPASFINAYALGAFGDMTGDGVPEYATTGATFNLALAISGGRRAPLFEHLAGAYDVRTGVPLVGFPRVVEDYTFFHNTTILDVSGDNYAEMIVGTAGYYVHAFDACGREAEGFPKFTGQWIIPSIAAGDMDGDQRLEITSGTRSGFVYAWRTRGRTDGSVQWPTFRHDNANTGNYGTALDIGVTRVAGQQPIVCPVASRPDAGVATDGGADSSGPPVRAGGGCSCHTAGTVGTRASSLAALGAASLALALARRRRRAA